MLTEETNASAKADGMEERSRRGDHAGAIR